MALCTQNKEPAYGPNLICLSGDGLFVLCHAPGIKGPGGVYVFIVRVGKACGVNNDFVCKSGFLQVMPGEILGVSTQDDVSSPACHVGGDGDGAQFTGLGYDFCLFFVVFGVEDVMLDFLLIEKLG